MGDLSARVQLSANLRNHPPPPTPPHHAAKSRAGGGEKKTRYRLEPYFNPEKGSAANTTLPPTIVSIDLILPISFTGTVR